MSIWDDKVALERLEKERDSKRAKGERLTYDCLQLKFRHNRAYCSLGNRVGHALDGSIELVSVLRGMTCGVCKKCESYSIEEGEQ